MMSPDNPIPSPESSPSRLPLEVETPCVHCGYSLRGLATTGRCPECGSPVADSTHGDRLRFAPPKWLNQIRLGILLRLLLVILAMVMFAFATFGAATFWATWPFNVLSWMAVALFLLSCFLITAQEPRTVLIEKPFTWRRTVRWLVVVFTVQSAAGYWIQFVMPPVLFDPTQYVLGLLWLPVVLGEVQLLGKYASRAANIGLAQSIRNCFRLSVPSALILLSCITADKLLSTIALGVLPAVQAIGVIAFILFGPICIPWLVWIYTRCYRMLHNEWRMARSLENARKLD
jgi:hypothetical protein